MFKFIKTFIAPFIRTTDFKFNAAVYPNALESIFGNNAKSELLYRHMVKVIVDKQFTIDIPYIINTFKEYNFTEEEYHVVMFKLGTLAQAFVEHPDVILRQAIRMTKVFSPEAIKDFQLMLETVEKAEDIKLAYEYEFMMNSKQTMTEDEKQDSEDEKANKMIDNWLKNKKE